MLSYPNAKLMGAVFAHFEGRLLSTDAVVAMAIVAHLKSEGAEFDPSINELARIVGRSRRTVAGSLARLRADRVIGVSSGGGRCIANRYRAGEALLGESGRCVASNRKTVQPASGNDAVERRETAQPVAHSSIEPRIEATTPPKPPRRGAGEPDGFEAFYAAYPWKAKRPKAAVAFRGALAKAPCERIMAGLARWCGSEDWRAEDGRFIPMPASWLNGERWNDAPRRMLLPAGTAESTEPAPTHTMIDPYEHLRRKGVGR